MKAVITVVGCDRIGIIASITGILAESGVNILDISQTIMQNIFTMIMIVDLSRMTIEFSELGDRLDRKGAELGLEICLQREEIFTSMHRI
jgi:ACT domain-containing protein